MRCLTTTIRFHKPGDLIEVCSCAEGNSHNFYKVIKEATFDEYWEYWQKQPNNNFSGTKEQYEQEIKNSARAFYWAEDNPEDVLIPKGYRKSAEQVN